MWGLVQQIQELRAALKKYGQHGSSCHVGKTHFWCPAHGGNNDSQTCSTCHPELRECSCGFEKAIKGDQS